MLDEENVVLVYLGADYIYNNEYWATIEDKEQDQDSCKVLCRQFGYTSTSCRPGYLFNSSSYEG